MFTAYKPPSIPVFPPHDDPDGDCLAKRLPPSDHAWPAGFAAGIAHRLDVQTSGAIVVADDPAELDLIRGYFRDKLLLKTYRFLAARDVSWHDNVCSRPIAHDRRKKKKMVVQRGGSTPHRGKWLAAETRFRRIEGNLWQATMQSGVMHQIRVHAAFVGLPLLGDRLYGGGPGGFSLHHVGLTGPIRTDAVPLPEWASPGRDRR